MEYMAVDEIPIAFCKPDPKLANGSIALWIPYLAVIKHRVSRVAGVGESRILCNQF
jgi:hypothetical protein